MRADMIADEAVLFCRILTNWVELLYYDMHTGPSTCKVFASTGAEWRLSLSEQVCLRAENNNIIVCVDYVNTLVSGY